MMKLPALSRNARIHLCLIGVSLLLIIIPAINKIPSQQVTEASVRAAAEFLFLVDTEEYAKSWEVTSENLKKILTKETWNEQIAKLRGFVGPVIERIHHDIAYTNSAVDVPPGEYVVMTFISRFKFKERVIETITLFLDSNDQWQVVGYFLS